MVEFDFLRRLGVGLEGWGSLGILPYQAGQRVPWTAYGLWTGRNARQRGDTPVLEPGSPRSNPGGGVDMSEGSGSDVEPAGDFDVSSVWLSEREVAVGRLAEAFRARTGVEYDQVADEAHRKVGLVDEPMTARDARKYRMRLREKVILAGTTLLYAVYGGGLDPEELDEVLEDAAETATGLVADERAAIPPTAVIRGQDHCPNCGSELQ